MMRKKRAVTKKDYRSMEAIHRSFRTNLESLEIFVANLAPVAEKHDRAIRESVEKFAEHVMEIVGQPEDQTDKQKYREILGQKSRKQLEQIEDQIINAARGLPKVTKSQAELLHKSSFVMLISYFDFLFSDLIRYFYEKYPESLSGKELSLTLSELKLFDSIADATDFIINKEVDNVLYGRLEKQKNYFKTTLKIDTKDKFIDWDRLEEAMERRHIIVHNGSKINRRYLNNVDLAVIPEKQKELKEGKILGTRKEYFERVLEEVLLAGLILIQCCWRKWGKDTIDEADWALNRAIYDALVKENWRIAERLGFFSKECEVASQTARLYLDVNYCQSLKWQGRKPELEKELKQFDVSTLSPKYVLAVHALKSDADNFYKAVENAIIVDDMKEVDFMEWPLFRELGEDPAYKDRIKAAFTSIKQKEENQSTRS